MAVVLRGFIFSCSLFTMLLSRRSVSGTQDTVKLQQHIFALGSFFLYKPKTEIKALCICDHDASYEPATRKE